MRIWVSLGMRCSLKMLFKLLASARHCCFEGQQTGRFEGKHGISRHEAVCDGDGGVPIAGLRDLLKAPSNSCNERIRAQVFAHPVALQLPVGRLVLSLELSPFHGRLTYTCPAAMSSQE